MKKTKSILIPIGLSTTILLPILPFITSCSSISLKKENEIEIDKNKDITLLNIINDYVNQNTLTKQSQILSIEEEILNQINKLFNQGDIFQQVNIELEKNNNQPQYSVAVVKISLNPKYKLILNNNSNFFIENNTLILKNNLETKIEFFENQQYEIKKEIGLTNIGTNEIEFVSTHKRNPQTKTYETRLMKNYGESHSFIYPGYNRNYEANWGQYATFYKKPGYEGPTEINGQELVYNERIEDGSERKYNDPGWISEEINKGTFKKHPAANNFFENKIDSIDSVTAKYEISTIITGTFTLGLYAPPGEVITITFDDETFEKIEKSNWSSQIVINENFWDNRAAPDSGQISNRYPFLESIWTINKNTKSLQFGSPFGGGISLRINNKLYNKISELPIDSPIDNIKFTITGAIPCMFYQDGITTFEDWENQKMLVQENKLAPIIQANGPFNSFTMPFTGLNNVGGINVKDLKYPRDNFKKWNDFLYLSNYYAGRDLDNNVQRLNMEFCDDIWGGAGAWGGGMSFYCPVQWGTTAFFAGKPIETFNPGNSWGVFHEINHNFQQDSALFSKRGHGETNQVTAFDLSVINDGGRARSELNYSGDPGRDNNNLGWSRLNNPFVTIYDITRAGSTDEYPIYSLLLFMFGSKKYSDYLRWDVRNHPNSMSGWNGFEEIKTLSNHFKLNLWPAFFDYGKYWHDSWPTTESEITSEQRNVINQLEENYPAVDFVGNHYACGNYIYNYQTQEFEYGGDITTPWEIEAGKSIILNLEKFIVSTNNKFNWTNVEFNPTTSGGGKLELVDNSKNLKYTPPSDPSIIDEFDIAIIPGNWENKSTNYVPKYKFKIKMRQVVNEPILTLYGDLNGNNNNQIFENLINGDIPIEYSQPMAIYNTNKFNDTTKKQALKIEFNFVAPKDGDYTFKFKWDDAVRIFFNDEKVFSNDSWTNNFNDAPTKSLKKNEILHVEIYVINNGGPGGIEIQLKDDENNSIEWIDYSLIPNYQDVVDNSLTPLEVLTNDKYKYKTRNIDKEVFDSDITSSMNLSDYNIPYYDPNKYQLSSKYGKNVQNLNNISSGYFELWNSDHDISKNQAASSFQVTFDEPTLVKSLFFGHRNDNHWNARATHITVTGYLTDSLTENTVVLYDGEYGKEFNDRSKSLSILNLDKEAKVKHLTIDAYNTNQNALIWQWFRPSGEYYRTIKSTISVNDQAFRFSNNWSFKNNDEINNSAFNNLYATSINDGDIVKINLKNSYGFNLIGQSNQTPTQINIYVNGKKINIDPITINSEQRIDNHCLYQYRLNDKQDITIEIEHLDNNPLFLNYIMTF